MSSGELGLLGVAMAGVLILVRLWRTAEGRAARLQAESDGLASDGKQLAADLAKQVRARKRLAEELSALRNKADKAKRRQSKTVEQPLGTASRIRDHEAQLARAERERDGARSERDDLKQELARLEARLEASARALAEASEESTAPAAAETPSALEGVETKFADSRAELTKSQEELGDLRQTEARLRKRMSNQDQLYASLRAELDVKKDRLRTQEEQLQRLQALKVAVID